MFPSGAPAKPGQARHWPPGAGDAWRLPSGSCQDTCQSWAQLDPRGETSGPLVAAMWTQTPGRAPTLVQSPMARPHWSCASSWGCQEPEPATQARAAQSAQGGLTAELTSSFNIAKPTGGLTILKKQITHTHFGRKHTDKIQVPFFKKKKFLNLNFYKSTTAWISLVV